MSIATLIFSYVAVLLGVLAFLVVYAELRRRRFEPRPTQDRIFRCADCGFVYTDDPDADRSFCPQCRKLNDPFEF